MSRIITVYSSQGKNGVEISTDVSTYGQLKPLLTKEGFKHDGMNAIISETDNLLIGDDSQLLDGDFTLIMTPKKTKAGAASDRDRKTCYSRIKEIVTANPAAKDKFTEDGKNYTQIKTDTLNKMIDKWEKKNGTSTSTTNVAEVVDDVKESKTTSKKEVLTVDLAIAFLRSQKLEDSTDQETLEVSLDEIAALFVTETKEEKLAREKREQKDAAAQAKIDKYKNLSI